MHGSGRPRGDAYFRGSRPLPIRGQAGSPGGHGGADRAPDREEVKGTTAQGVATGPRGSGGCRVEAGSDHRWIDRGGGSMKLRKWLAVFVPVALIVAACSTSNSPGSSGGGTASKLTIAAVQGV